MAENVAEREGEWRQLSIVAVRREVEALTDANLLRIRAICDRICNRSDLRIKGITVDDLMNEAFSRLLSGVRIWHNPDAVPFVQLFIGVVRSLVSHEGDSIANEFRLDDDDGLLSKLCNTVTPERQVIAREALDKIEALFADDDLALMYVMARADGVPPSEMPDVLSVSKAEVEAARKRVSRKLLKEFTTEGYYDC